jgi:hypothetical protein
MADKHESRHQSTEITIPAGYLEDARSALVAEVHSDGDALRVDQGRLVSGSSVARDDRAGAMRLLRNDVHLLDQLLEARGDTKVAAERDTITEALQAIVRVLTDRLVEQTGFVPLDMGAVLDLVGRLRWAAEEAVRIDPDLAPDASRKAA